MPNVVRHPRMTTAIVPSAGAGGRRNKGDINMRAVQLTTYEMIASGQVHIPVAATYALSSIKEAVAHAQRGGKILLDVAGSST